jgi:hypothetical protein
MVAKVVRRDRSVQLIVFFAVIREILRREIYAMYKQIFCSLKTMDKFDQLREVGQELRIDRICFVNRGRDENSIVLWGGTGERANSSPPTQT